MADLFRATTEVLLVMTVVGLAASVVVRATRSETPTRLTDRNQQAKIPQPGTGGTAVIALDARVGSVEMDGHSVPLAEFLRAKDSPDSVVLRLKGTQWRELTAMVRNRDLHFIVETDP
jgi:hypothetical protein